MSNPQPCPTPQLTLPEVREQLLRLAGVLGPLSERDTSGSLREAIIAINTAALHVRTAHRINTTPQGPVQ